MKSLQAPNLKTIVLTKVMYTTIMNSYDEQAFNMSEESQKKNLSLRNCCSLFQVRTWLSRPKNIAASDPSEVTQEIPEDPESEAAWDCLMKDIIK